MPLYSPIHKAIAIAVANPFDVPASSCVCILDDTPSKYPNSVFDIEPSCILVASIAAPDATLALTTAFDANLSASTASSANSAVTTPPSLIVTAPLDTEKLSELNEATPLLEVVASSPLNVTVPELSATSKPSPAAKVAVPPNAISVVFDPSETVIDELDNLAFAILPANCAFVIVPDKELVG